MGFITGTKVRASNGYKNIEDIKIGDFVLTNKNRYRKVTDIEVIASQPITEIRTLSEKVFYTTNSQYAICSKIEQTHYTDTKRKLVFDVNCEDCFVGFEHIAKIDELGCAFHIYDKITSITNTHRLKTVYNLKVEEDNCFVVEDRIFGGI